MTTAWICSLIFLLCYNFTFYSKTSSFIWASDTSLALQVLNEIDNKE